ncbi:hypothetical protein RO575_07495 [Methylomonas sp. MO1]|uniref:hypothetical protein n=1 Tax=Methylomonas sp. MO1 TaxID=3073619 RepID=UPI00047D81AB|nr:hypothetical protein [Methylomonas sp. MO1]MDT4289398.1 hypothetical protein [Methylomonas sp. MO1]
MSNLGRYAELKLIKTRLANVSFYRQMSVNSHNNQPFAHFGLSGYGLGPAMSMLTAPFLSIEFFVAGLQVLHVTKKP